MSAFPDGCQIILHAHKIERMHTYKIRLSSQYKADNVCIHKTDAIPSVVKMLPLSFLIE